MFDDLLSIVIITYNRAAKLQRTLRTLMQSQLGSVPVTVLNNASTDDTLAVCEEFAGMPNFRVVTHKFNIGGGANIMRAYEYADTPYMWIMSDDDFYDFSQLDDLKEAMESNRYDLIHIGCTNAENHADFAGRAGRIQDLMRQGYNYFRLSSNVVCSIVRTEAVRAYIRKGYDNVVNYYPHMPFLLAQYEQDSEMYITRNRILQIYEGGTDNYSFNEFVKWWVGTSIYLKDKRDRRKFISSQFMYKPYIGLPGLILTSLRRGAPAMSDVRKIIASMPLKIQVGVLCRLPWRLIQIMAWKH